MCGSFSVLDGSELGKNVITSGADMSSWYILILRKKIYWFLVKWKRWFRCYYVDCRKDIFYKVDWAIKDILFKVAL